jgi:hypothetical protein
MKRKLMIAALAATGLACSDPAAPVSGRTFLLTSVDAHALPVAAWQGDTFTAMLVADTVRFDADGTGTEVVVYRFDSTQPLEEAGQTEHHRIEWTQSGATIQFVIECDPSTLCLIAPALTGTIGADGALTVTYPDILSGRTRRFEPR